MEKKTKTPSVKSRQGMRRLWLISILYLLLGISISAWPSASHAATTFSIESVDVGLGQADLKSTTLSIIRWVLGIMTLVAVTMIIASIIIAATASDSDRAEKAKRTIAGAVIGMIIILLAWAIVFFVARTTSNVTSNT